MIDRIMEDGFLLVKFSVIFVLVIICLSHFFIFIFASIVLKEICNLSIQQKSRSTYRIVFNVLIPCLQDGA